MGGSAGQLAPDANPVTERRATAVARNVFLFLTGGIARTGRWNGKCSAQSPTLVASANSTRHKTAFFNLRPGRDVFGTVAFRAEMRTFRPTERFFNRLLFHEKSKI